MHGLDWLRSVPYMFRVLALSAGLLVLTACASYTEETREIRSDFRSGRYDEALAALEKSSLRTAERNRLLYRLEKAMILDRMGERDKSRRLLLDADRIVDELITVSVSRTAASFVTNEAATDYGGEDYEKVAIHTMLALSFLEDNDLNAAGIAARRINTKLIEINQGYDEGKNRYGEDAFARYLAGTIYEARGDWDSAIIDYAKALELHQGFYREFVSGGVPDELVTALYRMLVKRNRKDRVAALSKSFPKMVERAEKELKSTPSAGQLVVVHETGRIAIKETFEHLIPFGRQVVRLSFPVIRRDGGVSEGGRSGVTINGRFTASENVQDMDAIASQSLEDRRGRLVAKQAARLLTKGQITEQAYQNFGPLGGLAANVYTAATETADTRGWTLLPEAFQMSRVRLAPGTYDVAIKTSGRTESIRKVEIVEGGVVILRSKE